MPVINLPRDERWGDLGKGIGSLITNIAEGYMERQTREGVAQVMEDPNVADTKKYSTIVSKFGKQGADLYKESIATQVLQATIEGKKAEAQKDLAAVGASALRDRMLRDALGLPPAPSVAGTPTAAPGGATSSAVPTTAPPRAPTAAAPAPAAPSTAPTPSTVAAPTSAPASAGTGNLVSDMIDQRAAAGGVTITPDEKATLSRQVVLHMIGNPTAGLADISAPIDKFIAEKQKGAKFPSELSTSQAGAQTAAAGAQTAEAKAKVDLAEAEQRLRDLQATSPYKAPQAEATLAKAQQEVAAAAPIELTVPAVKSSFPTFSDEQAQAVSVAAKTGGAKAATAEITKLVDANAKGAGVAEGTARFLRDTASYGAITERFANEMAAAPEKLGLLGLSGVKARAEAYGLPVGDTALVNLLNSQKLAAAEQARQSGQFGISGTNLKLSKDTAANIDKTAVSNVMMFAGTAQQKLAEAEVEKRLYEGNPRAQAAIDAAVQPWRNIQAITNTLTSYVDTKGAIPGQKERDVMYFMGNQVNPYTMAPLVRQDDTEYRVKPQNGDKRTSYTGSDIFELAKAAGIDPAAMLTQLGGKPGDPIKKR